MTTSEIISTALVVSSAAIIFLANLIIRRAERVRNDAADMRAWPTVIGSRNGAKAKLYDWEREGDV